MSKNLESMKNFSCAWVTGSTNLNVLDHAASEVHKVALTRMHADAAKARGESVLHKLEMSCQHQTVSERING